MADAIGEIILRIFDYFFSQNAPMTIAMFGITLANVVYLRNKEYSIVLPLKVSKIQAELIKLQMDMAEKYLDSLHAKLYGLYRHQRRIALESQGMTTTEARDHLEMDMPTFMHSLQLWGVHGVIRSEIRSFFKDNHLADRDEENFRAYLERRKDDVWTAMVQAMNEYWFSGMTAPSRSDIYDCHEENKKDILLIVEGIFIEGRRMAIEYKDTVDVRKKTLVRGWL